MNVFEDTTYIDTIFVRQQNQRIYTDRLLYPDFQLIHVCNEACKTPLVRFMIFSFGSHYYQKQEMLSLELKESHKK